MSGQRAGGIWYGGERGDSPGRLPPPGLDALYVTMVEEGDPGGAEELPAIVARIENDQIALGDTQLVMEDDTGNILVYSEPKDIFEVLTRNID